MRFISMAIIGLFLVVLGCVKQADVQEARVETAAIPEMETTATADSSTTPLEENFCRDDDKSFPCLFLATIFGASIADSSPFVTDPYIRWEY